jgi:hypothetical protein
MCHFAGPMGICTECYFTVYPNGATTWFKETLGSVLPVPVGPR